MNKILLSICLLISSVAFSQSCPVVGFTSTANQANGSNNSYTFISNSTVSDGNMLYEWNFGDVASGLNNTSTLSNPLHIFSGAGTYIVKLKVTNEVGGCADSTTQTIVVSANATTPVVTPVNACPVVDFKIISNTVNGNSFTFISTSTIAQGDMTYFWDLGNGTTSTLVNPSITYATPGDYTVKLVVTGSGGCKDSISKSTTFCAKVTAGFGVTANGICANNNAFSLSNTSTNTAASTAMTYLWSFGDGTTSTLAVPTTHTYTLAGEYQVKLVTTLISGDCVSIDSTIQTVSVNPVPVPIYVLYLDTDYTSIDEMKRCFRPGIDFSFISNSTLTKGEMNYKWTFGTTNFTFRDPGDNKVNARMIFNEPGTFPVKLVVTSDKGCKDSIIRNVYLSKPVSSFTTTVTPDPLGDIRRPTISFTNNSTDPGAINTLTHLWTYESGSTFTNTTTKPFASSAFVPTPNQFARGGNYTTSLRVTSDIGCVHTSTAPLSFFVRPEATFSTNGPNFNSNGQPVINISAVNATVDETPANLTYTWDFDDGTIITTNSPSSPSHTYTTGSINRVIKLTVTNVNGGLTSVNTRTFAYVYIKPKSSFTFSRVSGFSGVQVAFNSSSSTTNEAGTTLTYNWNFGDGSPTSSAANPTHTYTSGGSYTVTLTVTNSNGGLTDVSTQTVAYYVTPVANFSISANYGGNSFANPTIEVNAGTTTVNDASANLRYSWNFGDGTTTTPSVSSTNSHVYATGGNKTITLTVTNLNGNTTDTKVLTTNVVIVPKAVIAVRDGGLWYEVSGNEASAPSTIATGSIASYSLTYSWVEIATNLASANVVSTDPVNYITNIPGFKIVLSLTVTSNLGVSNTATAEIGGSTPGGFTTYRTTKPRSGDLPILDIQRANVDVINTAPNPTNNSIRLSFKTNATRVNVQIVDLMGRVLQKQTQATRSGMVNAAIIDVSRLPRGNYNVNIYDEKGSRFATSKFMKMP